MHRVFDLAVQKPRGEVGWWCGRGPEIIVNLASGSFREGWEIAHEIVDGVELQCVSEKTYLGAFVSKGMVALDGWLTSLFALEYAHTISRICLGSCDTSPDVTCSTY